MVNNPASSCWDRISEIYAVAANIAACWKPAPKLPSLIFPMKNPESQHWKIMPTENTLNWSCIAIAATDDRLVLTTVVIMLVVNATIVVVTAISMLQIKAKMMYGFKSVRLLI